jgi:exopolysaccharide biosynthesis polyprenyl glycosylphosphotransferase
MKHRFSFLLQPASAIIDILSLNGCFILAHHLTFGLRSNPFADSYLTLVWFFNAAWLLILLIARPYHYSRLNFTTENLLINLLKLAGLHVALVSVFGMFTNSHSFSRTHLITTYLLFLLIGALWRVLALVALKFYRAMGYNTRRFIIVGYGELSNSIRVFYETHPEIGFKFLGYFDQLNPDNASELRGDYSELRNYVTSYGVDCVYCCLPYMDTNQLKEIMAFSEEAGYQVKLIVDFKGFLTRTVNVEYHDIQPVIGLSTELLDDLRINVFKRTFDIGFSSLVMVAGSPLFVILALITKFSSKGPIFYSQERIGQWGKPFRIYKFRSMYTDAEVNGPSLSSGAEDPRITSWGLFMRKTRVDELPQFYNVLLGNMSIVGPRPERQHFIDQIVKHSPEYKVLLTVKPGITSIGQIEYGYAADVDQMVQRVKYDLQYLQNISFSYDIWLIMRTVRIMMQGRGQ